MRFNIPRAYRWRWQSALLATNVIGALIFVACVPELSGMRFITAFFVAWLTGFWAAVLVEIATQ